VAGSSSARFARSGCPPFITSLTIRKGGGRGGLGGVEEEAGAPVVGDVVPGPVHEDVGAVAEPHQLDEVEAQPHQPTDEPMEAEPVGELDHGFVSTDGRHRALVAIVERQQRFAAPCLQHVPRNRSCTLRSISFFAVS